MTFARFFGWVRTGFRSASWQPVCSADSDSDCHRILSRIVVARDTDHETLVLPEGETPIVPTDDDLHEAA